jgi:hypothetical protein
MAQCRGCGAEIIWAITPLNKKAMPLDAKPEKRFILSAGNDQARLVDTYISHFATCPKAADFRRDDKPK